MGIRVLARVSWLLLASSCQSDLEAALANRLTSEIDAGVGGTNAVEDPVGPAEARDEPTASEDGGSGGTDPVPDDDASMGGTVSDDDALTGGAASDDLASSDDESASDDDEMGDDDLVTGDDDAVFGDDDTVADDDATADDDVTIADDDASVDDDVTIADDDATVDDDAVSDDDVTGSTCGNGAVEATESCDDGNLNDRDGCARDCTVWFDRDYPRRTRIDVVNPTLTALGDFPVLVALDDASLDWTALGDGVCFVDADQSTILAVDEDVLAPGSDSLVWVRLPNLAANADELWIYYGAESDAEGCSAPGSAWRGEFRAVFHMNDATDSASGHAMTDSGTTDAPGAVGRARSVAPSAVMESEPSAALQISGDLTISAWVRFSELDSGSYRNSIVTYGDPVFATDTNFQYGIYLTSATNLFSYWAHGNATTVQNTSSAQTGMPLNEFHHLAMVRDATAGLMRYYYDGAELGAPQGFTALPDGGDLSHLVVGGNAADEAFSMTGVLDEVRISAWAAEAAWIEAEYASTTGTMLSFVKDP